MANGRIPLIVTAPEGTDLRREPHRRSKTDDGEDNVILLLPKNTYLRLENEDIHATGKYRWARVSHKLGRKPRTGWALVDDLGPPAVEAGSAPTYAVSFLGKNYTMEQDRLQRAKDAGYIFIYRATWGALNGIKEITIDGRLYLTTELNVTEMKASGWIK